VSLEVDKSKGCLKIGDITLYSALYLCFCPPSWHHGLCTCCIRPGVPNMGYM